MKQYTLCYNNRNDETYLISGNKVELVGSNGWITSCFAAMELDYLVENDYFEIIEQWREAK